MKRSDGRLLKSIDPFDRLYPYLIARRSDATVFSKQIICVDPIEAYIRRKRETGIRLSYLHVFVAAYVRVIAERPKLNRFVMNSRYYARYGIHVSMVVKRSLHDDSPETTVKFAFTGHETIFDVIHAMERIIEEAGHASGQTDADRLVAKIMSLPGFALKTAVSLLLSLDRHNLLPRSVLEGSPFHATLFVTYLKSIKSGYVYHHPFNLGTSGMFVAIGKVGRMPIVGEEAVVIQNCCELGYTMDDRICDGLYLANSLKLLKKYLNDPYLLETSLADVVEDVE